MSIQKMRLQRGWSQQQLADASGLSVRTVQRIESGHAGSIESIKSIAAVFDVDFSTLSTQTSEATMVDKHDLSETNRERIAFMRARRIRGYYQHLSMYLVVTAACAIVDLLTTPQVIWFIGVAFFWGIGVLAHTLTVFVFDRWFGGEWELAQVEKLLGRPL